MLQSWGHKELDTTEQLNITENSVWPIENKGLGSRKIEGRRRRGQQRMRWLDCIIDSMEEFEQAQGAVDGQRVLACRSP